MLKQSFKTISILTALLSLHSVASATCVGTDCQVDVSANVDFTSNYSLDPDHKGIYIQSNLGSHKATVNLLNVVMRENGDITGTATAIGNNIGISLSAEGMAPVRHVSQNNVGSHMATVKLVQNPRSLAGEVQLDAVAIGNNFSLNLDHASLAELSVAQCNVGNQTAAVEYRWDPTKLTASASAIGNNISIGGARP